MNILLYRRRLMKAGKPDPYKGFQWDKATVDTGSDAHVETRAGYCLSPKYSGVYHHSLTIHSFHWWAGNSDGDGYTNAIGLANWKSMTATRPENQQLFYSNSPNTITANTGIITVTFLTRRIDDSYIYDNTTGEYIFKGINVGLFSDTTDWEFGYMLNKKLEKSEEESHVISTWYPISSSSVTIYLPTGSYTGTKVNVLVGKDANGNEYRIANLSKGDTESYAIPEGTTHIKFVLLTNSLNNTYVKEENGDWVWKGINIPL